MVAGSGSGARRVVDVAVVGGGIVGLATARSLLRSGVDRLVVLEAEDRIGVHQTGHNSGVIHSGLYYAPGSLKAQTCSRGREAMYRYCREAGIPHRRCGKLVVASREDELSALDELARRGRENGLEGIRRLSGDDVADRAPGVTGVAGLWVPQTGITDFRAVARSIARDVEEGGGEVRTGWAVEEVRPKNGRLQVAAPVENLEARRLVNCAGLESDRVARMCGVDPGLQIVPFRGDYCWVDDPPDALADFPVYPVPDPRLPFLGVHYTPDLEGRVEAGPNAALAFSREGYDLLDFNLRDLVETLSYPGFWRVVARFRRSVVTELARSASRRVFARGARGLVPALEASQLRRGRSGVRAQAVTPDGALVDDFRIARGEQSLHVLNAPSPAATAALAIGDVIAEAVLA